MDGSKEGIMKNQRIQLVKYAMLIINIIAILSVAIFVYYTTDVICDYYVARDFLDAVSGIPWRPQLILMKVILCLAAMVISFCAREYFFPGNIKVEYATILFDFFLSMVLVFLLDFNYNGILFWVFANSIAYIENVKGKFIVTILAVISFIATNYELISIRYRVFRISDYIGFYEANIQQYFLGAFNILILMNLLFFILFCIFVIQTQKGTIDEVSQLYEKLSETNEELKDANIKLEKYADMKEKMGKTKERNRLAREIHDTLGHTLTGISAGIDACIATIDHKPDSTKQQLELISNVTRSGIKEIRRSVSELRPDALERFRLEDAIQKMIADIDGMANTKVYFETNTANLKFDEDEENAIYRVVQESVTNSIRHGHAGQIWIRMEKNYGDLHINIKDDGIGCKEMKKGFGTRHIIERIDMLKGKVSFDGENGFETDVIIPIRWGEEYD